MTQEYLKEILKYDKETGLFIWKKHKFKSNIGKIAGSLKDSKYINIHAKNKEFKAHRLAWLYIYGEFPKHRLEHINKIQNDNRLKNIREMIPPSKSNIKTINQYELKKLVTYNKLTGDFTWNYSWRKHKKNEIAGSLNWGYLKIEIGGKKYDLHRLVFLYLFNKKLDTKTQVDHINHVRHDNRLENLRIVTNSINQRNTTLCKNNKSGVMGVYYETSQKRWTSSITVNRKSIFLGRYEDKKKAIDARKHAEKIYKFHVNHGI